MDNSFPPAAVIVMRARQDSTAAGGKWEPSDVDVLSAAVRDLSNVA
ncbi:MAG: hypothetical protein AVDCRST_MAG77-147 [uncultured Chloroflexi bacterium]|uniref:Uncharacterized protein n=1 Tax=uncultured Chloroflexota bacterium TaxID=166587 RepID=A0A6J4H8L8_9CHLR|nr:MAG: hypothetical protein AVDCRST_MAG77-147 [uncultured Chloroflexota bacterium]